MSNSIPLTNVYTKTRRYANLFLALFAILGIGSALWAYSSLPWYLAVAIIAFITTLGISGELILFLLVYKGVERWPRRRTSLPPFNLVIRIVANGYMRALGCFFVVVLIMSLFHPSLAVIFRVFSVVFMGINIFVTFLSSDLRSWNKYSGLPIVLCIGYVIQLLFLLVLKLL